MRTIWKYEVTVQMPVGAKVLHIGTQNPQRICLWALVDPHQETVLREFYIIGTGSSISDPKLGDFIVDEHAYLGMVQDGEYVWHIFGRN